MSRRITTEQAIWGLGVWTERLAGGFIAGVDPVGFRGRLSENGLRAHPHLQNASASDITVRATFLCEDGTGVTRDYLVRGGSHSTYARANLPGELNGLRFATMLESSLPFVAERATYWGTGWNGGHASAGTPWPSAIPTPPPASIRTPTLTSVSPASGPTTGGTTVTLTGTDFLAGAVYLGGVLATSATIPLGNSTTITAVTRRAGGARWRCSSPTERLGDAGRGTPPSRGAGPADRRTAAPRQPASPPGKPPSLIKRRPSSR